MGKHVTVSASEANRSFSRLLRAAREGARVTITSHGKPVAVLAGADDEAERQKREAALQEMRVHWAGLNPTIIGPWTREDLYEQD